MAAQRSNDVSLSRSDWLRAGYQVLSEAGPQDLKITRLCELLGVTKGSFYWHFADLEAYRTALIENWVGLRTANRDRVTNSPDATPRQKLLMLMDNLVNADHWIVERAMRDWSQREPTIAEEVRRGDRWLIGTIRDVFRDNGFDSSSALLRAFVMVTSGLGMLQIGGGTPPSSPKMRDEFLDMLMK